MASEERAWPELPWKVKILMSAMTFVIDMSCRSNFTVNRCLMNLFDFKSPPSRKPIDGVKSSDILVDASLNLWFRLFEPTTTDDGRIFPVIVFFHGGGFAFMAANSKPYDDFCRRLALDVQAIVISVNYRLSPEHRWPSQYEDGFDVLKFMNENPNFEGLPRNANLKHCFLAGDSAGGNLAHHVAIKASEHDFCNLKLVGLIAIQPFFGGEERTESERKLKTVPVFLPLERTDWMWKAFLPEGSDRNHPSANVFGPNSIDITGVKYPATIVFVEGFDPLQDWQKRYYEGLKKCGKEAYLVEYPNAVHSFYAFPELPESSLFIDELKNFVQKQIHN